MAIRNINISILSKKVIKLDESKSVCNIVGAVLNEFQKSPVFAFRTNLINYLSFRS